MFYKNSFKFLKTENGTEIIGALRCLQVTYSGGFLYR